MLHGGHKLRAPNCASKICGLLVLQAKTGSYKEDQTNIFSHKLWGDASSSRALGHQPGPTSRFFPVSGGD